MTKGFPDLRCDAMPIKRDATPIIRDAMPKLSDAMPIAKAGYPQVVLGSFTVWKRDAMPIKPRLRAELFRLLELRHWLDSKWLVPLHAYSFRCAGR